jgi:hypothetical protein
MNKKPLITSPNKKFPHGLIVDLFSLAIGTISVLSGCNDPNQKPDQPPTSYVGHIKLSCGDAYSNVNGGNCNARKAPDQNRVEIVGLTKEQKTTGWYDSKGTNWPIIGTYEIAHPVIAVAGSDLGNGNVWVTYYVR